MRLQCLCLIPFLLFTGCANEATKQGPPKGFQNIKLGLTSGQFLQMTNDNAEQLKANTYRLNSPTDKIEFLDCYFTKDGEHLFEIEMTHFIIDEPKAFQKFINKKVKKYGQFTSRSQRKVKSLDHPLLEVIWLTKEIRYEVRGERYGKSAEKVIIIERIRDIGYLQHRRQEELNDMYRDRRRMIETGAF